MSYIVDIRQLNLRLYRRPRGKTHTIHFNYQLQVEILSVYNFENSPRVNIYLFVSLMTKIYVYIYNLFSLFFLPPFWPLTFPDTEIPKSYFFSPYFFCFFFHTFPPSLLFFYIFVPHFFIYFFAHFFLYFFAHFFLILFFHIFLHIFFNFFIIFGRSILLIYSWKEKHENLGFRGRGSIFFFRCLLILLFPNFFRG